MTLRRGSDRLIAQSVSLPRLQTHTQISSCHLIALIGSKGGLLVNIFKNTFISFSLGHSCFQSTHAASTDWGAWGAHSVSAWLSAIYRKKLVKWSCFCLWLVIFPQHYCLWFLFFFYTLNLLRRGSLIIWWFFSTNYQLFFLFFFWKWDNFQGEGRGGKKCKHLENYLNLGRALDG